MITNKLKATGIHFFLSVLVIAACIAVVYFIWFTPHLFFLLDAPQPLKILILVDVILGPILTFIVYKKGKKTLKFDLSVIVLIQLAALVYGLYSTYLGRPITLYVDQQSVKVVTMADTEFEAIADERLIPGILSKPTFGVILDNKVNNNAPPSVKVPHVVLLEKTHWPLLETRQSNDVEVISRVTGISGDEFITIIKQHGYASKDVFINMIYAKDLFHIIVSDRRNFKIIDIISDPDLL